MKYILILILLTGCSESLFCVEGKIYEDTFIEGQLREIDFSNNYKCTRRKQKQKEILKQVKELRGEK